MSGFKKTACVDFWGSVPLEDELLSLLVLLELLEDSEDPLVAELEELFDLPLDEESSLSPDLE
jgi:hypothetical protein